MIRENALNRENVYRDSCVQTFDEDFIYALCSWIIQAMKKERSRVMEEASRRESMDVADINKVCQDIH